MPPDTSTQQDPLDAIMAKYNYTPPAQAGGAGASDWKTQYEAAKAKYATPTASQPAETPGIIPVAAGKTAQDYANAPANFMAEAGRQDKSTSENPIIRTGENALGATASGLGTVFAPISNTLKAASDMFANSNLGKQVGDLPGISQLADFFGPSGGGAKWAEAHPEAARNLQNAMTLGLTVGGEATGVPEKPIGSIEGIKSGISDIGTSIKENVQAIKDTNVAQQAKALEDAAIKQTTPDFAKATVAKKVALAKQPSVGETPRVSGGGFLKSPTVASNEFEQAAGKELSKVPGYDPKASSLETHNLIMKEIGNRAEGLRAGLKAEEYVAPRADTLNTVSSAVNDVSKTSLSLQNADPKIDNYLRVAKNAIDQNPEDLEGILNVRQALDDSYENAGGKYAGDKALDEIHGAARDALNKILIDNAKNADVKASLKGQTNLYRADDVISSRIGKEAPTGAGRMMQNLPKPVKAIGRAATKALPIGGAIELMK